jgi:hypothetical protein
LGDKGLAARYMRDAKQLLARVHGIRGATGAPVFALRRAILAAGVLIQAQSFGMIDVITIHAFQHGEISKKDMRKLLMSGVVFDHYKLGISPWQGVSVLNGSSEGPDKLRNPVRWNWFWKSPSVLNPLGFANVPPTLDDRQMAPMHSHSYYRPADVHVVTQIYRRNSFDGPVRASRVFINGVEVLTDDEGANFIGARLYDDVLAVAILSPNWDKIHVTYFPISTLSYQKPFFYSEVEDELNLGPTLSLPWEAQRWQCVFDFHPTDRAKGTFLLGKTEQENVANGYDKRMYWAMGRYYPTSGGAPDSWIHLEESGDAVVFRRRRGTVSTNTTRTITKTPGPGTAPTFWWPYGDSGLGGPEGSGYSFSINYEAGDWRNFYPSPAGKVVHDYSVTDTAFRPPLDPASSVYDYTATATGNGIIDRQCYFDLTLAQVPVWTGFNTNGHRVVCRIDGTLTEAITSAQSYNTTHTLASHATWDAVVVETLVLGTPPFETYYYKYRQEYYCEITGASSNINTTFENHILAHEIGRAHV